MTSKPFAVGVRIQHSQEVINRNQYGSNIIPDSEPTTFWAEFKETFKDPMIKILLAIAALMIVMFIFGDLWNDR